VIGLGLHVVYKDEYKVCRIETRNSIAEETGGAVYDLVCRHNGWEIDRVPIATKKELEKVCRICNIAESAIPCPSDEREYCEELFKKCEWCVDSYLRTIALKALGKITLEQYIEMLRSIDRYNVKPKRRFTVF
jgi:hypothetical protein